MKRENNQLELEIYMNTRKRPKELSFDLLYSEPECQKFSFRDIISYMSKIETKNFEIVISFQDTEIKYIDLGKNLKELENRNKFWKNNGGRLFGACRWSKN